jgi:hypothetical protein
MQNSVAASPDKAEEYHPCIARTLRWHNTHAFCLFFLPSLPGDGCAVDRWTFPQPEFQQTPLTPPVSHCEFVMSTLDQAGLAQLLDGIAISTPTAHSVDAAPMSNPLDLCRSVLAELLAELVHCDVQTAYRSIQWPNNIFNGDLSVTVPKLCPGRKPTELSSQLVDKVGFALYQTERVSR